MAVALIEIKGPGKDTGRVGNGHRGIIGRESDGRRKCDVRKTEEPGSSSGRLFSFW